VNVTRKQKKKKEKEKEKENHLMTKMSFLMCFSTNFILKRKSTRGITFFRRCEMCVP
jgi:hypothetical protein